MTSPESPPPDALTEPDGDDSVHEPSDGQPGVPPEPGAGLGAEVEETDPEDVDGA